MVEKNECGDEDVSEERECARKAAFLIARGSVDKCFLVRRIVVESSPDLFWKKNEVSYLCMHTYAYRVCMHVHISLTGSINWKFHLYEYIYNGVSCIYTYIHVYAYIHTCICTYAYIPHWFD